jgi:hypothetical protein
METRGSSVRSLKGNPYVEFVSRISFERGVSDEMEVSALGVWTGADHKSRQQLDAVAHLVAPETIHQMAHADDTFIMTIISSVSLSCRVVESPGPMSAVALIICPGVSPTLIQIQSSRLSLQVFGHLTSGTYP